MVKRASSVLTVRARLKWWAIPLIDVVGWWLVVTRAPLARAERTGKRMGRFIGRHGIRLTHG